MALKLGSRPLSDWDVWQLQGDLKVPLNCRTAALQHACSLAWPAGDLQEWQASSQHTTA